MIQLAPPEGIRTVTDKRDMEAFLVGVRGETGVSPFVLQPTTTEEVVTSIRHCAQQEALFVPQSANTGLVGASVPDASGETVVLSLAKLRNTFELDIANRSLRVSAGFRLSEVNERLAEHGLFFPIDLGSDPLIGGMVATNTGGGRFLRYGDVRQNVLGLTVVLNGEGAEVLQLGSPVRKDNTGPDWKQNFIGTFGWFGVITEVTVNLEPVVREQAAAIVVPRDGQAMLPLLRHLETRVGPLLSAFEFMSGPSMRHALDHAASLSNPFANGEIPSTAILVELSRPTLGAPWDTPLDEVLQSVLAEAWELEGEPIDDALFGRPEEIWALRHALSEGVKSAGSLIAFDLGFTRDQVIAFREVMSTDLPLAFPQIEICDFGHLGDGGLHFNLVKTDGPNNQEFETELRDWVVSRVVDEFGGSYSAEHGLGPKNIKYFRQHSQVSLGSLETQLTQFRQGFTRAIDG